MYVCKANVQKQSYHFVALASTESCYDLFLCEVWDSYQLV